MLNTNINGFNICYDHLLCPYFYFFGLMLLMTLIVHVPHFKSSPTCNIFRIIVYLQVEKEYDQSHNHAIHKY